MISIFFVKFMDISNPKTQHSAIHKSKYRQNTREKERSFILTWYNGLYFYWLFLECRLAGSVFAKKKLKASHFKGQWSQSHAHIHSKQREQALHSNQIINI